MSDKEDIKRFVLSQIDKENIDSLDNFDNWIMKMSSAVLEKRLTELEGIVNELYKKSKS
jgi:hypothetical protein